MLVHNPERLVEVYKQLVILPIPCQYLLSLMNSIINSQELFIQIHIYTILTQGISTVFIEQMPTYLVFKKVHSMLHKHFQQFTTQCDNPQE